MPRYIIKITDSKDNQDYYLEWSSIVDAPITYGMSLGEFKKYYKEEYGNAGMDGLESRLERVEKTGISAQPPFDKINIDKEFVLKNFCRK